MVPLDLSFQRQMANWNCFSIVQFLFTKAARDQFELSSVRSLDCLSRLLSLSLAVKIFAWEACYTLAIEVRSSNENHAHGSIRVAWRTRCDLTNT